MKARAPSEPRVGLGLAALGRPAYITLGRERDFGSARSAEEMYDRASVVLDAAWAAGVRHFDVARSYGRSEEFLARWMNERSIGANGARVSSKWGYRYTGAWRLDAAVQEEKEHSLARFHAQLAESRHWLGGRLALYQIHSATLESGCLEDQPLLTALVAARDAGAYATLGLTLSGPRSAATLDRALAVRVEGVRVFDAVQATFNLLEPSLAGLLATAHAEGVRVIAKEVLANGRLSPANERPEDAAIVAALTAAAPGVPLDQLGVAWVLAHPFIDVALSGAATPAQVRSHVAAVQVRLPAGAMSVAATIAEPPERYWATRATLPWS